MKNNYITKNTKNMRRIVWNEVNEEKDTQLNDCKKKRTSKTEEK